MDFDRTAARYSIPELVDADRAHAELAARMPGVYADDARWAAWHAAVDEALAAKRAAEAKVAGLLCVKCDGKGRILGYSHRSNGLCYRCNGDGWTAKGRKAERARLAALDDNDK